VVGESFTLTLDNGSEWHLLGNATPLLDEHDMPRGAIGAFLDITELKRAERALRDSEARVRLVADAAPMLIHAQEEERARIARELHDDICQRLAILQIKAERFGQDTALSPDASREVQSIVELAAQLSSDTSALSHRLHPSTLDTLGLVSALKGLCREFSEQFHVHVDFVHHDVPEPVDTEVRTSVFRIVQEALRNVVKHSGVTAATVELSGNGDQVEVCISDAGAGFEPDNLGGKPGLGLISMRERLRRIGGALVIQSAPSRGTRIRVAAPARLPIVAPAFGRPEPT
jgi:signal transduction histidine kinase